MALVAYSDSEGSDAEPEVIPTPPIDKSKKSDSGAGFQVDRSNPRKIRVALPELKPEQPTNQDTDDGPARKRVRLGGGSGGALSGFNALLPAPKRAAEKKPPVASTRKVFSLKTGATPGFDREADAEMKNDQAFDNATSHNAGANEDDQTIPAAGSLGGTTATPDNAPQKTEAGEVKLQGNPMMFRPLSVGRMQKKKKTAKPATQPTASATAQASPVEPTVQRPSQQTSSTNHTHQPPAKPKVSLFSLTSEDSSHRTDSGPASTGTYEPLVYNTEPEAPSDELPPTTDFTPTAAHFPSNATVSSSLDNIANDLNLSRSERRQLFGRNAPSAESRILTFDTDKEYASNQALAQTELAAVQHNPVRSIAAGGKHSLQQLVNAATSQKEALEESFAAGRRNKKEAGSRYGW
ncbi:uncharacterized protein N7459_008957 [Penicillium hispanicum]|uniref:uncharacterized protein n=1 Tax=Penicillium hispanicum TaxID=1080232 RepID=UPI002541CB67|nr:uncharacterized protein N7459_008957 [Penicillium hispanicum]KAJ5569527.1 hypothetical protein N7459_008957 [Penicillium hispanicum]